MTDPTVTRPLVSVVIPAYKARNYLRESLASVAAQDYPHLEVWVIDDKSPEPIDDILAGYRQNKAAPQLELIRHEENQGLGAARNTGIRAARGEFVAFLDHDDLWAPGHVSSVMAAIRDERGDLGYCTVELFDEIPGTPLGLWGPPGGSIDAQLPFRLFETNFITPSSVIASKGLLDRVSGFSTDPRLHMCEDLDMWLRALLTGASFAHAKNVTTYYRKHPSAATSRAGYMAFQSAYVRQLHCKKVSAPWFKKRAIIAKNWWSAWVTFLTGGTPRWDVLTRAIWQGLPVPWEIARGIVHTLRFMIRRPLPNKPDVPDP